MYHVANTYLPTISLVVIVEITLFFDATKLDISVTLSLTIMLVMYTLYQSISYTIPQTAYLKLIDYWLIFCLLTPFFIFIIETAWYLEQNRKQFKKINEKFAGWVRKGNNQQIWNQKRLLQVFIPVLTTCFILFYFGYAVYLYYFP
jgi:hypothetical protein